MQHAEVRAWFADPASRPDSEHTTTDADNGRIEVRRPGPFQGQFSKNGHR
jgi:hypothetical protein